MATNGFSRRHFFQGALMTGAVPAGGFGSTPSLKAAGFRSPNEKLNIASIGAGGRAADDINGCAPTENIVAFADPDSARAAAMFKRFEKAAKYTDFRKMLDKEGKNIDAVIIATPDFMHGTAAMWGMERGKHVKEEKVPDTLDWDSWIGIQDMRPYSSAYLPFNWRGWKDFGTGPVGDELIHTLGAPNLALRLTAPTSVEVIKQEGKNPYSYAKSTVTRWEFPARGAMPPAKLYWYDASGDARYRPPDLPADEPVIPARADTFPRQPAADGGGPPSGGARAGGGAGRANVAGRAAPAGGQAVGRGAGGGGSRPGAGGANRGQNQGVVFVGDKGYLAAGGEGTEGGGALLPTARMRDAKLPPEVLWRSPGHYTEWIMACKGCIPRTMSDFAFAAPLAETVLLSVIAIEFEGKLEYDAEKGMFTNNKEANKYLQPPHFRKGWSFT